MARDKTDIICDVLQIISKKGGSIKPTRLMYGSNLSHKQMKLYTEEMIKKSWIKKIENNEKQLIEMTDNGRRILEKLLEMREFEITMGLRRTEE